MAWPCSEESRRRTRGRYSSARTSSDRWVGRTRRSRTRTPRSARRRRAGTSPTATRDVSSWTSVGRRRPSRPSTQPSASIRPTPRHGSMPRAPGRPSVRKGGPGSCWTKRSGWTRTTRRPVDYDPKGPPPTDFHATQKINLRVVDQGLSPSPACQKPHGPEDPPPRTAAAIRERDIVWVRDEKNRQPLAVGRAIMDGPTMAREERGKAIETLHYVGDDIWRLAEEET